MLTLYLQKRTLVVEACTAGLHHSGFFTTDEGSSKLPKRLVFQRISLVGGFRKRTLRSVLCSQAFYLLHCGDEEVAVHLSNDDFVVQDCVFLFFKLQSVENVDLKVKCDESQSKVQTLQSQVISMQVSVSVAVVLLE